jgi:hypothetical protein
MLYKATSIFHYESNLPGDEAQNTFWLEDTYVAPVMDPFHMTYVINAVIDFYNVNHGPEVRSVGEYLADFVVRATPQLRVVQVNPVTGLEVGEPYLHEWSLSGVPIQTEVPQMPAETALCLSFGGQGALPEARRKGRIYIGPLSGVAIGSEGEGRYSRPHPVLIQTVRLAAQELLNAEPGPDSLSWVVYSRAAGATTDVQGGWIDNEWDTQRRRGRDATVRTPWPSA